MELTKCVGATSDVCSRVQTSRVRLTQFSILLSSMTKTLFSHGIEAFPKVKCCDNLGCTFSCFETFVITLHSKPLFSNGLYELKLVKMQFERCDFL